MDNLIKYYCQKNEEVTLTKCYAWTCEQNGDICYDWGELQSRIKGKQPVKFRKFYIFDEAVNFINKKEIQYKQKIKDIDKNKLNYDFKKAYAFASGFYDENTEKTSYGGFILIDDNKYEISGLLKDDDLKYLKVLGGEIKAVKEIIIRCINENVENLYMYINSKDIKEIFDDTIPGEKIYENLKKFAHNIKGIINVVYEPIKKEDAWEIPGNFISYKLAEDFNTETNKNKIEIIKDKAKIYITKRKKEKISDQSYVYINEIIS